MGCGGLFDEDSPIDDEREAMEVEDCDEEADDVSSNGSPPGRRAFADCCDDTGLQRGFSYKKIICQPKLRVVI